MFFGILKEAKESIYDKDKALKELKSNISKSISKIKARMKTPDIILTSKQLLSILLKGYTHLQEKVNKVTVEDSEDNVKKLEKSFESLEKKKDKVFKLLRIRSNTISGARRLVKGK